MPSTALADWLRSQDDAALVELLRTRPDLAVPPPADSMVLATRAGIPAPVARACEDLDRFIVTVLTALVVAGADTAPVSHRAVGKLLGSGVAGGRIARGRDGRSGGALACGVEC